MRQAEAKIHKAGNKEYWKKKAEQLDSYYIRQRDAKGKTHGRCITCGKKVEWKYADVGHFKSRRHGSVFFHEKNQHLQCKHCNKYRNGEEFQHGIEIDKMYGEGTAEQLHWMAMQPAPKRTWYDYYLIAQWFHDKIVRNGFELPNGCKTIFE